MARTYTQDFVKDDGTPITVEYEVAGSYSPTTYSPLNGADGGDAPEISIIKVWPDTAEHDALNDELLRLEHTSLQGKDIRSVLAITRDDARSERIEELKRGIAQDEERVALTDAERERMEAWLYENYEEDYDDEPF